MDDRKEALKKQDNSSWIVYVIIILVIMDGVSRFLAWESGIGLCNSGVSFGMLSGVSTTVIIAVEAVVVLVIGIIGLRRPERVPCTQRLGTYFLVAGGISHIISRIMLGCVWDWIELAEFGLYADLADIMIDVGIVFVLVGIAKQLFFRRAADE